MRASWLIIAVGCVLVAGPAWAQKKTPERAAADRTAKVPLEQKNQHVPTLIGLQAYREVLASGRYLLGPGDRFLVYITGMEEPLHAEVMAEGGLFIPGVGSVSVGGMDLQAAKARVQTAFHRAFRKGRLTLQLEKARSFPVAVVGAVGTPGQVQASAVERVSEVIHKAGDLDDEASRRNIRLVRIGRMDPTQWEQLRYSAGQMDSLTAAGVVDRVDLELFDATGDSRYNPFVEDGDRIIVPARTAQVAVRGGVNREGRYEFVAGDRVSDLLALALGLSEDHDPNEAMLFRDTPDGSRKISISVDLPAVLAGDSAADLAIRPNDWLVIRRVTNRGNASAVHVMGQVRFPGFYVVEEGKTRLRDAIERAGGFTEDASLWKARLYRAAASEFTEKGRTVTEKDPEFERIATIPVADRTEEENQYFIMKTREKPGQMVVDFVALFQRGDESQNILLMSGDLIVVPRSSRTVIVSGQAAYPGALPYHPGLGVMDYIRRAGGFGWRASHDVRVIKARTGEIKRASRVTRVDPGDRIWIKEKREHDYWAIFRDTMSVVAQLSTIILVYHTLAN